MMAHHYVMPWMRWAGVEPFLRIAYLDSLFFPALYGLLTFNFTCILSALWLALKR